MGKGDGVAEIPVPACNNARFGDRRPGSVGTRLRCASWAGHQVTATVRRPGIIRSHPGVRGRYGRH